MGFWGPQTCPWLKIVTNFFFLGGATELKFWDLAPRPYSTCFFLTFFWFYKLFWSLIQKKLQKSLPYTLFLDVTHYVFRLWFITYNLIYVKSAQKQVTDISLVLKDSDMESENFSSLIRLSVSDGQKTDSSKDVSFIGIYYLFITWHGVWEWNNVMQ